MFSSISKDFDAPVPPVPLDILDSFNKQPVEP
jgi:hypothetical protein